MISWTGVPLDFGLAEKVGRGNGIDPEIRDWSGTSVSDRGMTGDYRLKRFH
jgi:hypothetical protein